MPKESENRRVSNSAPSQATLKKESGTSDNDEIRLDQHQTTRVIDLQTYAYGKQLSS